MAEAQVGLCESGVPRLYARDANSSLFVYHVARKNFFRHRQGWPRVSANISVHFQFHLALDRRQEHLLLHAGYIEGKKAAVYEDVSRDCVLPDRQLTQRNFYAAANPINQGKIRRG